MISFSILRLIDWSMPRGQRVPLMAHCGVLATHSETVWRGIFSTPRSLVIKATGLSFVFPASALVLPFILCIMVGNNNKFWPHMFFALLVAWKVVIVVAPLAAKPPVSSLQDLLSAEDRSVPIEASRSPMFDKSANSNMHYGTVHQQACKRSKSVILLGRATCNSSGLLKCPLF